MQLKTIIENIQRGSATAEKKLFLASDCHLMTVALRYVVDKAAAKDVVQESYIRIFNTLPKFRYKSEAATMAWMRRITSREAIRWLKKQQRWQKVDIQPFAGTITESHPMFADDLYRNLLILPTNQRLVFNMHAIEGYSHKEIAAKLEIAESSSRSLLTRARKKLVQQIENQNAQHLPTNEAGVVKQ